MIAHADDHLSHPAPVLLARCQDRHLHSQNWGWTSGEFSFAVMRRYPRINPDFGVYGRAVLPLFCLAPHGVFPASRITPRAVSSYLAISPLPALLSKNRRCLFCDTLRHRNFATAAPASFTRHAAVWCSDFPLANLAIHQRSSAIGMQFSIISNPGNQELIHRFGRLSEILRSLILRCRNDLRSSINKIEKEATRSSRGVLTASGSPAFGRGIVR